MPRDPHAQKVAFERGLMDAFGLTRNQVREGLKSFNNDIELRRQGAAAVAAKQEPEVPTAPTTPKSTGAQFDPQPFTLPPAAVGGGAPPPGDRPLPVKIIDVCMNGYPGTMPINAGDFTPL